MEARSPRKYTQRWWERVSLALLHCSSSQIYLNESASGEVFQTLHLRLVQTGKIQCLTVWNIGLVNYLFQIKVNFFQHVSDHKSNWPKTSFTDNKERLTITYKKHVVALSYVVVLTSLIINSELVHALLNRQTLTSTLYTSLNLLIKCWKYTTQKSYPVF